MDDEELAQQPGMTAEELSKHRGQQPSDKIYMCVDRRVFDVSDGRDFYGPEGRYHVFAGRDCTRALALGSFEEQHMTGDTQGLSSSQLMAVNDWLDKLESKYPIVAQLVSSGAAGAEQKL